LKEDIFEERNVGRKECSKEGISKEEMFEGRHVGRKECLKGGMFEGRNA
jgi:hypothetical protein